MIPNQRKHQRFQFSPSHRLPVILTEESTRRSFDAQLVDLSLSGFGVLVTEKVPHLAVGRQVVLYSNSEGLDDAFPCDVVWGGKRTEGYFIGLRIRPTSSREGIRRVRRLHALLAELYAERMAGWQIATLKRPTRPEQPSVVQPGDTSTPLAGMPDFPSTSCPAEPAP